MHVQSTQHVNRDMPFPFGRNVGFYINHAATYPSTVVCKLRNQSVYEQVAHSTSTKVSSLFLNNSHDVLAHIFLLKGPAQTNKALSFILQHLQNAADNESIDLQSVVKSCLVPLLAQLVIGMGDENPEKAELVMQLSSIKLKLIPLNTGCTGLNEGW